MRLMFAILLASPLLACRGPAGQDGAPGKDGTFKRTPSYCNSQQTLGSAGNNWTVTAPCNNQLDIPLSGECFAPNGLPSGAALVAETPVAWEDMAQIAAWSCQWTWQNGATPSDFFIKAEICCATP